jgi:putative aldouronate transport system substrate-binding protein
MMLLAMTLLISMVAACSGNSGNSNNSTSSGNSTSNNSTNGNSNANSNSGGSTAEEEPALEHYDLTMVLPIIGAIPPDIELVQQELNKITEAKINTTVTIEPISVGAYIQQLNLKFSSSEKMDISFMFGNVGLYEQFAATGKYLEIEDVLKEYGQGIIEAVGEEYVYAPKLNGKLYSVPTVGSYGTAAGYYMRKDILDKYNIDVASIKTLDDIENILKIVKENEPDIIPVAMSGGITPGSIISDYDVLGGGAGVLPFDSSDMKLVNMWEKPEVVDRINVARKWFQAGYVNKDAATTSALPQDLYASGRAFSYFSPSGVDSDISTSLTSGYETVVVSLTPPYVTTGSVMTGLWTIAHQSEDPARAMMFLNLMYTDAEVANILAWGIEGTHYKKVSDNQVDFADGLDAQTSGYNMYATHAFMLGNPRIMYLSKDEDPNKWNSLAEWDANAIPSPALGFSFNAEPVKNEMVAVQNVSDQYYGILMTGSVDPESKLPEFIEKLKVAGIDKIIEEKQNQLDEWVAANQ